MTNTPVRVEVLKSDVLGRVHTPQARREALLEEFERSGVSGKKFAAMVGVNYQTFASWVQKRRKAGVSSSGVRTPLRHKEGASGAIRLVEAVLANESVAPPAGTVALCVRLPGGAEVKIQEVRQVELLAELLRALVRPC